MTTTKRSMYSIKILARIPAFFLMLSTLFACSSHMTFVSPMPGDIKAPSTSQGDEIPIFRLGEPIDREYDMVGHVFTSYSFGLPDTLPLNDPSSFDEEAKQWLREIAKRADADAIISANHVGFYGWLYLGQGISGIAVKYRELGTPPNGRQDFIACVMPTKFEGENKEFDAELRIMARHFLTRKGYYVLTPEKISFNLELAEIVKLNQDELNEICGHPAEFFVFFHKQKGGDDLSLTAYSLKEGFFIQDGKTTGSNGSMAAGGFISGGLIGLIGGAWAGAVSAGETEVKALIEPFPNISMSCTDAARKFMSPKVNCKPID